MLPYFLYMIEIKHSPHIHSFPHLNDQTNVIRAFPPRRSGYHILHERPKVCHRVKSAIKRRPLRLSLTPEEIGLLVNLAFTCYDRSNGKIDTRVWPTSLSAAPLT